MAKLCKWWAETTGAFGREFAQDGPRSLYGEEVFVFSHEKLEFLARRLCSSGHFAGLHKRDITVESKFLG